MFALQKYFALIENFDSYPLYLQKAICTCDHNTFTDSMLELSGEICRNLLEGVAEAEPPLIKKLKKYKKVLSKLASKKGAKKEKRRIERIHREKLLPLLLQAARPYLNKKLWSTHA